MKTIVIVENEAIELASLVHLFEQWQKEINILTATEQQAAINIMASQQVDLVVCDLGVSGLPSLENFSMLTHSFPHVPCIALARDADSQRTEAMKRGASSCLGKPIDNVQLLQQAGELLDNAASGTIRGIPIHSFLQMLESEGKTCTLEINGTNDVGLLFIKNGILIGAETKNFVGEEAAQLILSWPQTIVQLRHFNGQRKKQISSPLISIIMEAFRLRNDREHKQGKQPADLKHQLPLRHFSTMGKRIPLEIGVPLELEFPNWENMYNSNMIGMVTDSYLIVANPLPHADFSELVGSGQRALVKFTHRGRVWMFKTDLLKAIESPSPLLFFAYPSVIHYHELRKEKRTTIFIPSTFHLGDQPPLYGALIDLSMTGGLCQIKRKERKNQSRFELDSPLTLRCLLPGIKEEQKIGGRIKNINMDNTMIRLGIEFTGLQPHVSDTIGKYLFAIDSDTVQ